MTSVRVGCGMLKPHKTAHKDTLVSNKSVLVGGDVLAGHKRGHAERHEGRDINVGERQFFGDYSLHPWSIRVNLNGRRSRRVF